jgi:hypothetical protein
MGTETSTCASLHVPCKTADCLMVSSSSSKWTKPVGCYQLSEEQENESLDIEVIFKPSSNENKRPTSSNNFVVMK